MTWPFRIDARIVSSLLGGVVLVLDQVSKHLATLHLSREGVAIIPGFFDLTLVHNPGAAFGLFNALPGLYRQLLLVGVALLASGVILYLLSRTTRPLSALALGWILGGALGNLVDRLRFGWVVDFIHVHWHDLSWPVFNIADSAITLGIGVMVWESFTLPKEAEK
ncbi:MAG: signal peptidase II [Magnetococcales bacterium]|nr:signal peptidase II [Magnetococcales bacterium]MBF0156210.1 signal peptidase II [Magnetococcales bacterium]